MSSVTIHNTKINYEVYGKGKPMIFVHGWGGSITSLRKLGKALSEHRKVYLIDLPGFGKSDNPDPSWGVPEYAMVIQAFLEDLKIKKPVYFGHSFGGSLGIYLAARQPQLFQKLILCSSSYKRTAKQSRTAKRMNLLVQNYLPFLVSTLDRVKPVLYKIFFPHSDYAKYPHLIPNFRKIITDDLSAYPEQISLPTLLLWGERDTYTPLALAEELDEKINRSKLIVYPYKKHNLPIRYVKDIYPDIYSFITGRLRV
ncbi:MAG: alpha/beta fold hydrolase [Patescibacteria group bacterium]